MKTIQEVTDKARYVEWLTSHTFAVWHGGHTVNFYSHNPGGNEVTPTTCKNVGDFAKGNITLKDVKDGIETVKQRRRDNY